MYLERVLGRKRTVSLQDITKGVRVSSRIELGI